MKLSLTCVCLFSSIILFSQAYIVSATLSGSNEVPPNASTATGTLTGTYNASTNTIDLSVTYAGLTNGLTGAHLHKAPAGSNGGVIVNLNPTTGMTSGSIINTYSVDQGDESELIAGNVYVNLHTSAFPGGEIRGQLTLTASNPDCEVEVEAGDLCISDASKGVILKSENGTCYRIRVDDNGGLTTLLVNCP